MKTVKKGKEVRRVKDKAALNMTTKEGWSYCPKSEYKSIIIKSEDKKENEE